MLCVDVNVLVFAHRPDAPDHAAYRTWLEAARRGSEPLGISPMVLNGFLRVVTHPRVFQDPTPLDTALASASAVRSSPNALELTPGARHWEIFTRLCREADARGNLVPDAYLAAMAIEAGATWCTADRDFARFPALKLRHPLRDG
jgi:uncharacterized protein